MHACTHTLILTANGALILFFGFRKIIIIIIINDTSLKKVVVN